MSTALNRTELKSWLINLLLLLMSLATCGVAIEYFLRSQFGLGDPLLYDNNPVYGYRPLPDQHKKRFLGAEIRVNNLGLRCDRDWDTDPKGKLLFLGDSVTYGGSYIANAQLFSTLAARDSGFESCNAGVNAWGVDNIHGLVVGSGFAPAELYVTVVPEGDFYRGLTRMQGMPYYNVQPRYALEELLQYWFWKQGNRRYREWGSTASATLKTLVVTAAAARLGQMHQVLAARGFRHYLFISPNRRQALGEQGRDAAVDNALAAQGLNAVYIADELGADKRSAAELYVDSVHLSPAGHQVWADIIRQQMNRVGAFRNGS